MKKKILSVLITILAVCTLMFTLTACGGGETPHTHTYDQQVVNDTFKTTNATCEDKATYYYSCTCGEKGTETFESGEALGHSFTDYAYNEDATCEEDGTETAVCDNGCGQCDTRAKTGSKIGHDFDEAVYAWNGNNCIAIRKCARNENHIEMETSIAQYFKDTDATCTTAETGHYEACFNNPAFKVQVLNSVMIGEPLGHNYRAAAYAWSNDKCTATIRCARSGCGHVETETKTATYYRDSLATCTIAEKGHYVVNFNNENFATQQRTNITKGEPLGHNYSSIIYTWSGDKCTASGTCYRSGCGYVGTETKTAKFVQDTPATCTTSAIGHYEVTFSNAQFRYQSTAINSVEYGAVLEHSYNQPKYTWDGDKCTASRECAYGCGHAQTETVTAIYYKSSTATCTTPEMGYYGTPRFENSAFYRQETERDSVVKGEPLGHDINSVRITYTWETDKCTATGTCYRCRKDVTETVISVYVKDREATCAAAEAGHYEATFSNAKFEKQSTAKNSVTVGEPLTHKSGRPIYVWNEDQCTGVLPCSYGCGYAETETVPSVYYKNTPATCTTPEMGYYITKSFENKAFKVQRTEPNSVIKSPLGHRYDTITYTWDDEVCTAARICARSGCDHLEMETAAGDFIKDADATCTNGEAWHYLATFTNTVFGTAKKYVTVGEPLGHEYTFSYVWSGRICRATGNCSVCVSRITETATGVYVKDSDATCVIAERGHYVAEFTNVNFEAQATAKNSVVQGSSLGHTEVVDEKVEPTCTETGLTEGKHCLVCGRVLVAQEEVLALGHTEVTDEKIEPTCTETGLTEGKHCGVCDEVLVAQEVIDALKHDYQSKVIEPTCTEQGYTTHTCNLCGDSYEDTYVDALTHEEVLHDAKEPTCTEVGNGEYVTCARCDYTTYEKISALGHTEEIDQGYEPTCADTGLTEGKHCSVCGEVLVAQEIIEALGHKHETVVVEPTCTEEGYTALLCHCGDIKERGNVVPALGHDYKGVISVPTCTEQGYTTHTCNTCGDSYVDSYVEEIGHAYQEKISNNNGTHTQTCLNDENHKLTEDCDYTYVSNNDGTKTGTCECGYSIIAVDEMVLIVTDNVVTGLTAHGKTLSSIVIPNSVTSIGNHAFHSCNSLTSVVIGNSVTSIGNDAFYYCDNLTSVYYAGTIDSWAQIEFNDCFSTPLYYAKNLYINGELVTEANITTATKINEYAFYNCSSLTSVIIGDSVTTIYYSAFAGCPIESVTMPTTAISYIPKSNLKTVVITSGESIDERAFYNCDSLISVVILDSVVSIGNSAFGSCNSLTSVVIGNSVISVGDYAFEYCYALTNVEIGNSVTTIGSSAFTNCTSLTSIEIPNSVTSIGENAFYNCLSLTCVVIGDGVTSIGSSAFYNCNSLTSVEIGDSITTICSSAFSSCTSLTSVVIGDGVTTIGSYAFNCCNSLTSVVIGDGVTTVGYSAFSGCPIESATMPTTAIYYIPKSNLKTVVITSGESIGSYAFSGCSTLTSIIISDSVINIGDYAFSGCTSLNYKLIGDAWYLGNETNESLYLAFIENTSLTEFTINENTKIIAQDAFKYCNKLTKLVVPASVLSVGSSAFGDCASLKEVYISDLQAWLNIDFYNSSSNPLYNSANLYLNEELLTEVVIPENVLEIKNNAFAGCSSLTSVVISNSVTSIGDYAFENCESLIEIVIPDSVTSIGTWAFENCSSLTSVAIPDSVTSIGDYAFRDCDSLTGITIPKSITRIGTQVFLDCRTLTTIIIPNSVTGIGDYAFAGCTSLTSIEIPDSVTSISGYAFRSCSSLTSIIIPDSVTSIGGYAFDNCGRLTEIIIPESVATMGEGVFDNCDKLVIYCEVAMRPSGWSRGWNVYNCPVIWDCNNNDNLASNGSNYATINGIRFELKDGVATVIGQKSDIETAIIPLSVVFNDQTYAVTTIANYAFYKCDRLTKLAVPNSLTSVANNSFEECANIVELTCSADVLSYFPTLKDLETLHVLSGEVSAKNFWGWNSLTHVILAEGITNIKSNAFSPCYNLESIVIPKSVKTIEISAFNGCSKFTTIYYGGTQYDWYSIKIGNDNEEISKVTRYYYVGTEEDVPENNDMCWTYSESGEIVVLHKHKYYEEWREGECTAAGYIHYRCSVCGDIYQEYVETLGHVEMDSPSFPPTCTEDGWENGKYCDHCYEMLVPDERIPALGHTEVIIPAVAGTCISPGISEGKYCSVCGEVLVEQEDLGYADCVLDIVPGLAPTCTEPGYTRVVYCISGCAAIYEPLVELPATGHTYSFVSNNDGTKTGTCACGDSVKEIDESVLIVTNNIVTGLTDYGETLSTLNIMEGITGIGNSAFKYCSSLTSVTIPSTVTSIGDYAFYNCSSLTSITIPGGVTTIGADVFYCCSKLETVVLNEGLTILGDNMFDSCDMLKEITIPKTITAIPYEFCYGCDSLTTVNLHDKITSIDQQAFYNCTNLNNIVLYDSITEIGKGAFQGCWKGFTFIKLPENLAVIEDWAFMGSALSSIIIPKSVKTIKIQAFQYNNLEKVYYTGAQEDWDKISIEDHNANLTNATIYFYVANEQDLPVENGNYWHYNKDGEVEIWQNIHKYVRTTIAPTCTEQGYTTYTCDCGYSYVGDYVNALGHNYLASYNGDGTHTKICVNNSEHVVVESCKFDYLSNNDGTKTGTCECRQVDTTVDEAVLKVENGVLVGVTAYAKTLSHIIVSNEITCINYRAFENCTNLDSLVISNSVIEMRQNAFMGCYGISKVNYLGTIDDWAQIKFEPISSPIMYGTELYINDELLTEAQITTATSISSFAFTNLLSLESVIIGDSVLSIGSSAFSGCESLTSVIIGKNVQTIGTGAFIYCAFTEVVIPDSVTAIESYAFRECNNLTKVTIGNKVTKIAGNAFFFSSALTDIIYNGSVNEWNLIAKGENWNYSTNVVKVICTDGEVVL